MVLNSLGRQPGESGEKGGNRMAVKHFGEIYRCKVCGNKVEVIEAGGGTLVCCGVEMESIEDKPQPTVNIGEAG
jgi:superoxide reductase